MLSAAASLLKSVISGQIAVTSNGEKPAFDVDDAVFVCPLPSTDEAEVAAPPSVPVMDDFNPRLCPLTTRIELVCALEGHDERVWFVAWHPVEPLLASCSSDRTIRLWTLATSPPATAAATGEGDTNKLLPPPPPPLVAPATATMVQVFALSPSEHSRTIRSLAWSPCGRYLAAACFDGVTSVYRLRRCRPPAPPSSSSTLPGKQPTAAVPQFYYTLNLDANIEGHENEVKRAAFDRTACKIVTCSRDRSVFVFERETPTVLPTHTAAQALPASVVETMSLVDAMNQRRGNDWLGASVYKMNSQLLLGAAPSTTAVARNVQVFVGQPPLLPTARHTNDPEQADVPVDNDDDDDECGREKADDDDEGGDEVVGAEEEFTTVGVLAGHSQDVKCCCFHPYDSRVCISAGYDEEVKIWVESLRLRDDWHCVQSLYESKGKGTVWEATFQHDDLWIVLGATNGADNKVDRGSPPPPPVPPPPSRSKFTEIGRGATVHDPNVASFDVSSAVRLNSAVVVANSLAGSSSPPGRMPLTAPPPPASWDAVWSVDHSPLLAVASDEGLVRLYSLPPRRQRTADTTGPASISGWGHFRQVGQTPVGDTIGTVYSVDWAPPSCLDSSAGKSFLRKLVAGDEVGGAPPSPAGAKSTPKVQHQRHRDPTGRRDDGSDASGGRVAAADAIVFRSSVFATGAADDGIAIYQVLRGGGGEGGEQQEDASSSGGKRERLTPSSASSEQRRNNMDPSLPDDGESSGPTKLGAGGDILRGGDQGQEQPLVVRRVARAERAHDADVNCVRFAPFSSLLWERLLGSHSLAEGGSFPALLASAGDDGLIKLWKVTARNHAAARTMVPAA